MTTRAGVNFIGDPVGATGLGTLEYDYLTGDPVLGPLANYGGYSRTLAPLTGSPVLDGTSSGLAIDQRGAPRPQGGDFDIGAVEGLVLGIGRTGGMITVSWSPVPFALNLQSASGLSGPWTCTTNQDNPQTIAVTPAAPREFFQLQGCQDGAITNAVFVSPLGNDLNPGLLLADEASGFSAIDAG